MSMPSTKYLNIFIDFLIVSKGWWASIGISFTSVLLSDIHSSYLANEKIWIQCIVITDHSMHQAYGSQCSILLLSNWFTPPFFLLHQAQRSIQSTVKLIMSKPEPVSVLPTQLALALSCCRLDSRSIANPGVLPDTRLPLPDQLHFLRYL